MNFSAPAVFYLMRTQTMASDEHLYRRIREGDREAFDLLYDRYQQPVFRFLVMMLRNAQDAEDVFHEAWIAVLKSEALSFEQASFEAWLYQVARNGALNKIRARKRFQHAILEMPAREEAAEPERQTERLNRELECLPARLAQVYELRRQGRSYDEMAKELELPVGTIKSRMNALVRRLRERLKG